MVSHIRVPLVVEEPLTEGSALLRVPEFISEPLTEGAAALRVAEFLSEPLTEGSPLLRVAFFLAEALIEVPEEGPVATAIFPTLRGQKWDIKKNPAFNVATRKSTSGRTTTTAYQQYPNWNFELSYDWVPDLAGVGSGYADTDLRTLQGFFLQMGGSSQAWLFHDKDDFHVVGGAISTGDAVTLQWPFFRAFGGFAEPVGQIDLSVLETFPSSAVNTGTNAINVTAHGLTTGQGPLFAANTGGALPTGLVALTSYWAIRVDADHFQLASSLANAMALTPITLSAAGSGTDTVSKGVAVYNNGTLQGPAAYTITLPNQLVFGSAPAAGHAITADFDFWFVCRFTDDTTDFNQFVSKLWDLGKLNFYSLIQ